MINKVGLLSLLTVILIVLIGARVYVVNQDAIRYHPKTGIAGFPDWLSVTTIIDNDTLFNSLIIGNEKYLQNKIQYPSLNDTLSFVWKNKEYLFKVCKILPSDYVNNHVLFSFETDCEQAYFDTAYISEVIFTTSLNEDIEDKVFTDIEENYLFNSLLLFHFKKQDFLVKQEKAFDYKNYLKNQKCIYHNQKIIDYLQKNSIDECLFQILNSYQYNNNTYYVVLHSRPEKDFLRKEIYTIDKNDELVYLFNIFR
jgi:hypothetical protein